ncbi:LAME_0E08372g1_1 [Lachancea meyersii CBS 8951]|uniref:LAME_0E08372g1_1 n=1 Tax=Lachancea meyersii CBS 8951 TaxID=1266667 RepID=A0A1G4JIU6_9SACH|nr:LAME_0E08372g1_1 [Lachancea meyersii CBS 8951]
MPQDTNGAEAPKMNDIHLNASKDKPKRGNLHSQSRRGNSRVPKSAKVRTREQKHPPNNDFELNIQDELVHGNLKARGRKTQVSINHLLDFQLPEREKEKASAIMSVRRKGKRSEEDHIHLHGESFVNANFKFLVDDRFTYKEQSLDPNIPIPREKIVRVEATKGQSCPICLTEDIVAPRMISCGHLFCHTCMLSFFASGDEPLDNANTGYVPRRKKHKECPLCGTFVRQEKAVPVKFVELNKSMRIPQVGQLDTFELMCKPHGSMLPLPVHLNIDPMSLDHFPAVEFSELAPYTRIMKCSNQNAIDLYKKDLDEIKTQFELDRAIYNDDGKFAKLAMEDVKLRIKAYEETTPEHQPVEQSQSLPVDISQLSFKAGLEKYDDKNAFFFYQTAFEANTRYFLSPLDVKVLITAFGQYSNFPPLLIAQVEDVHHDAVVTESLLQKYKYFGHLPIGSDVTFVDLDWRSVSDLPPDVYHKFAPELNSRRRKSALKKQREDNEKRRHEKRLEREQEEFYMRENGSAPAPVIVPTVPLSAQHARVQRAQEGRSDDQESAKHGTQSQLSSKLEKTIWGTSIPTSEDPTQRSEEDLAFEKMLENINQQKQSESRGKKKKRMVTLLSSNNSRGTL